MPRQIHCFPVGSPRCKAQKQCAMHCNAKRSKRSKSNALHIFLKLFASFWCPCVHCVHGIPWPCCAWLRRMVLGRAAALAQASAQRARRGARWAVEMPSRGAEGLPICKCPEMSRAGQRFPKHVNTYCNSAINIVQYSAIVINSMQ